MHACGSFFSHSTQRREELIEIADANNDNNTQVEMACKTRWLSIRAQGLRNSTLNFGLFFETLLAAWLCYCPLIATGLGTRPLRFTHWMPGIPWSILIFVYDECRKYLMRATSPEMVDPETKRVKRLAGWIELNTYY